MIWVYKGSRTGKRRYLGQIPYISMDNMLTICESHYEPGKAYYFEDLAIHSVDEGRQEFGLALATNNPEPGECPRCYVPGQFLRTCLICPCCSEVLGGF